MTWSHPVYYGASILSIAMFLVFIGSFIFHEIISNRVEVGSVENVDDKYLVTMRTAVILSIVLLLISILMAISINLYVLIVLIFISALMLSYEFVVRKATLLKYIILPLIAGGVVISGGLAVEPKYIFALPGPIVPALFTMIFILIIEILSDIKNIEHEVDSEIRTIPIIIGIPKSLITIIFLFIGYVLITLTAVLTGWFGTAFKIITIYTIDLPMLVLLILIWGNPNKRMLSIGTIAFKISWILSMLALLII